MNSILGMFKEQENVIHYCSSSIPIFENTPFKEKKLLRLNSGGLREH